MVWRHGVAWWQPRQKEHGAALVQSQSCVCSCCMSVCAAVTAVWLREGLVRLGPTVSAPAHQAADAPAIAYEEQLRVH